MNSNQGSFKKKFDLHNFSFQIKIKFNLYFINIMQTESAIVENPRLT